MMEFSGYFRILDLEILAISRMEKSLIDSLLRDHPLELCLLLVFFGALV